MSQESSSNTAIYSFATNGELEDALAHFIIKRQKEALQSRDKFTIALSGGSLPQRLAALAKYPKEDLFWDKWHVYYVDERVVPLDHEDSNHNLCQQAFYSKVSIPASQIYTIDPTIEDMDELADAYETQLIQAFALKETVKYPRFDVILLGMGDDGHTASLFPGHPLLSEASRWVAPIEDSPKPPPKRITLTLSVINHASAVAFVVTGKGKADTMHTVIEDPTKGLPASRVHPTPTHHLKESSSEPHLFWFLDDGASAKLPESKKVAFSV